MYNELIDMMMTRPPAYTPNAYAFWDDPHISRHMLNAHLAPDMEAASRRHAFMRESAAWIADMRKGTGCDLLDLGCGPGLYAELFDDAGFTVTGIDLSERSIAFATESARAKGKSIRYRHGNYLCMDYENAFDVVTLIYCDLGVLAPSTRKRLLKKIRRALRPGGVFIADVWSERVFDRFKETETVFKEREGFWSAEPYVCVKRSIRYEPAVMLEAYHVVTSDELRAYYVWNQSFTREELARELHAAGFADVSFCADVCGRALTDEEDTLCALARKTG